MFFLLISGFWDRIKYIVPLRDDIYPEVMTVKQVRLVLTERHPEGAGDPAEAIMEAVELWMAAETEGGSGDPLRNLHAAE